MINSMQGKQVDMLKLQVPQRLLECLSEFDRGTERRHLRLNDELFARKVPENRSQLHLGGAITSRRFDVINAQFNCAANGGLEIRLPLK